jgi:riboflavin biosynthesis pyrimidine reductase
MHPRDANRIPGVCEEKFKLKYMRIDSGGVLLGKFLRNKLVDNVTVIIMPHLTGGNTPKTIFYEEDLKSIDGIVSLGLVDTKTVKGNYVALTYKVLKDT